MTPVAGPSAEVKQCAPGSMAASGSTATAAGVDDRTSAPVAARTPTTAAAPVTVIAAAPSGPVVEDKGGQGSEQEGGPVAEDKAGGQGRAQGGGRGQGEAGGESPEEAQGAGGGELPEEEQLAEEQVLHPAQHEAQANEERQAPDGVQARDTYTLNSVSRTGDGSCERVTAAVSRTGDASSERVTAAPSGGRTNGGGAHQATRYELSDRATDNELNNSKEGENQSAALTTVANRPDAGRDAGPHAGPGDDKGVGATGPGSAPYAFGADGSSDGDNVFEDAEGADTGYEPPTAIGTPVRRASVRFDLEPKPALYNSRQSLGGSVAPSPSSMRNKPSRRQSAPGLLASPAGNPVLLPHLTAASPVSRERGGSHDLADELDNASLISLESAWSPPMVPIDAAPERVVDAHQPENKPPAGGLARRDSLVPAQPGLPSAPASVMDWSSLLFCSPQSRRGSVASAGSGGSTTDGRRDEAARPPLGVDDGTKHWAPADAHTMPGAMGMDAAGTGTAEGSVVDGVDVATNGGSNVRLGGEPSVPREWDGYVREASVAPTTAASGGGQLIPVRLRVSGSPPSLSFISNGGDSGEAARTTQLGPSSRVRTVSHEGQGPPCCVVVITEQDGIHWAYFDDRATGAEFRGAVEASCGGLGHQATYVRAKGAQTGFVNEVLARARELEVGVY